MRYDTLHASSYLVWQFKSVPALTVQRDEGDLMLVHTRAGEEIMIYLVERMMTLGDLQYHLETNTARGRYSLFIFWTDMLLPADGASYTPDDWMHALLALHNGKIYGYEVAGRQAYFYPVYFEPDSTAGQASHRIRYGRTVQFRDLRVFDSRYHVPPLRGVWRMAAFDTAASPGDDSLPANPLAASYAVLGIPHDASTEGVKRAYRALARRYHPDVNADAGAAWQMKRINDAYHRVMSHLAGIE